MQNLIRRLKPYIKNNLGLVLGLVALAVGAALLYGLSAYINRPI